MSDVSKQGRIALYRPQHLTRAKAHVHGTFTKPRQSTLRRRLSFIPVDASNVNCQRIALGDTVIGCGLGRARTSTIFSKSSSSTGTSSASLAVATYGSQLSTA